VSHPPVQATSAGSGGPKSVEQRQCLVGRRARGVVVRDDDALAGRLSQTQAAAVGVDDSMISPVEFWRSQ